MGSDNAMKNSEDHKTENEVKKMRSESLLKLSEGHKHDNDTKKARSESVIHSGDKHSGETKKVMRSKNVKIHAEDKHAGEMNKVARSKSVIKYDEEVRKREEHIKQLRSESIKRRSVANAQIQRLHSIAKADPGHGHDGDSDSDDNLNREKKVEIILPSGSEGKKSSIYDHDRKNVHPLLKGQLLLNRKSKIDKSLKIDVSALNSTIPEVIKAKAAKTKPGGWKFVSHTFNPDLVAPMQQTQSESSASTFNSLSSKPTDFSAMTATLSMYSQYAKAARPDGDEAQAMLLNKVNQKRRMAQILIQKLHRKPNATTKPNTVLKAFMAFWNPARQQKHFLVPKDRAAWLSFLVQLTRQKTKIQYLTNKELKKVIIRARPNLADRRRIYHDDPDCPECFFWTKEQVADWIESIGFPQLREAFLLNCITGRRLVLVDVNALRQMGLKYFDEMKAVAKKIRELIGIPRQNILRAIMRIVPFEEYLKQRVPTGKTYDLLNFENFCQENGFDYNQWNTNKSASIPCTMEVHLIPAGVMDDESDIEKHDDEDEEASLQNAPTVEFIVRNSITRNKVVAMIIEEILKSAVVGPGRQLYGKAAKEAMKDALDMGFKELGLEDSKQGKAKLAFATEVAKALMREIQKTSIVLEDVDLVQKYIGETVLPEKVEYLKDISNQFMEDVMPLAALLAAGELDLEVIFKDATGMHEYIDEVIGDAEKEIDSQREYVGDFIQEVCDEAYLIFQQLKNGIDSKIFPHQVMELIQDILEEVLTSAYIIEAMGRGGSGFNEAFAIIAESKERFAHTRRYDEPLDDDDESLEGEDMDKYEDTIQIYEEVEANLDDDDGNEEEDGEKKKSISVTDLQVQVDNEVKIGLLQIPKLDQKGRKKRTELTVSQSLNRENVGSSLKGKLPFRDVESDTTLQKASAKMHSRNSLGSVSTGEFSVNSSNMKVVYSQAFKEMANERIKRIIARSTQFLKERGITFSLPNSPLTDGEEEEIRKALSDNFHRKGGKGRVNIITENVDAPLKKEEIQNFVRDFDKLDDAAKQVIYKKIKSKRHHHKNKQANQAESNEPATEQEIMELLSNLDSDDDDVKNIVNQKGTRRKHTKKSVVIHDYKIDGNNIPETHGNISFGEPLENEAIGEFVKHFQTLDNSLKQSIANAIKRKQHAKEDVKHAGQSSSSYVDEKDIAHFLKEIHNYEDDDHVKEEIYKEVRRQMILKSQSAFALAHDSGFLSNAYLNKTESVSYLLELEAFDNKVHDKVSEMFHHPQPTPHDIPQSVKSEGKISKETEKVDETSKKETRATSAASAVAKKSLVVSKAESISGLKDATEKKEDTKTTKQKSFETLDGFSVSNLEKKETEAEEITVLFKGAKIEETEPESASDAETGLKSPTRKPSSKQKPVNEEEDKPKSSVDPPEPEKETKDPSSEPKALVIKKMSLQSVDSAVDLKEKKSGEHRSSTSADMDEDDNVVDEAAAALKQMIKEKKLHRRQMVENWAHEMNPGMEGGDEQSTDPEEYARVMRITADQIVADIVQLALTHMLLRAEGGQDTDNILHALRKIKVTDPEDNHEHTVVLWDPHVPEYTGANSLADYQSKKLRWTTADGKLESKDGLRKASKEAIVSALKTAMARIPVVKDGTKTRRRIDTSNKSKQQDK